MKKTTLAIYLLFLSHLALGIEVIPQDLHQGGSVVGNITLTGNQTISGTLGVTGVQTNSSDLNVTGQTTFKSTATVQGNAFSVGGSTFVVNGGNAAIGGASSVPLVPLQVTAPTVNAATTTVMRLTNPGSSSAGATLALGYNATSNAGIAGFYDGEGVGIKLMTGNANIGPERMRINSSGNVGVGNSAPAYTLDVTGMERITGQLIVGGTMTVQGNALSVGVSTLAALGGNVGIGYATPDHQVHVLQNVQTPGVLQHVPVMVTQNGQATNATDVTAALYALSSENGTVSGTTGHRMGVLAISSDTAGGQMDLIGGELKTNAYGTATNYWGGLSFMNAIRAGDLGTTYYTGHTIRNYVTTDGATPNNTGIAIGLWIESMSGGNPAGKWAIYQAGASDPNYFAGKTGINNSAPTARFEVGVSSFAVTDSGFTKPAQRTLAWLQAFTPAAGDVGGQVICSNCAVPYITVTATGTTISGFAYPDGTGLR